MGAGAVDIVKNSNCELMQIMRLLEKYKKNIDDSNEGPWSGR
jgi:hypothetical protein